jgi:hypothetical protein
MSPPPSLPVDPGLRERFRAAGAMISWVDRSPHRAPRPGQPRPSRRPAHPPRDVHTIRIAHLNDEDARVETEESAGMISVQVDSGPLGALVMLLEMERLGPPTVLTTHDAVPNGPFPTGSIEARWSDTPVASEDPLPLDDLIRLARYALA